MKYVSSDFPATFTVEGIFSVLLHTFDKPARLSGESHAFPEIIYILSGSHSLYVDEKQYRLSAGQMMIYAPGAFHAVKEATGALAYILSFKVGDGFLEPLYNRVLTLSDAQRQMFSRIMEDGRRCFTRSVSEFTIREGADMSVLQRMKKQLEFFLADILVQCVRETEKDIPPGWETDFAKVAWYLQENLHRSLTLTEIADGCSMSVSKLKMLCRAMCGCGPIRYCNMLKIEHAKRLIAQGGMNFTEIAEALGFSSLHYFSRLFRKTVGISPSDYAHSVASEVCSE